MMYSAKSCCIAAVAWQAEYGLWAINSKQGFAEIYRVKRTPTLLCTSSLRADNIRPYDILNNIFAYERRSGRIRSRPYGAQMRKSCLIQMGNHMATGDKWQRATTRGRPYGVLQNIRPYGNMSTGVEQYFCFCI